MEKHLQSLQATSESIQTLYFRPPYMFTNSVTTNPNIIDLIRDPEPDEARLFTINKDMVPELDVYQGTSSALQAAKDIKKAYEKSRDVNVDVVCDAVDNLTRSYPMPGVEEKTQRLRKKAHDLAASVHSLEGVIEDQERQLKKLDATLESKLQPSFLLSSRTFGIPSLGGAGDRLPRDKATWQRQVDREKQEIEQLKAELARKRSEME
ncbi:hypothetical protein CJU89_2418 [Yarrowia sp. B02]|nr:hypothetical protein CJU89_2418 [Yarrowia sp. B02]